MLNVSSPDPEPRPRVRDPRRRSRRRLRRRLFVPLRVLLVLGLLALGIWLGGHPNALPSPVRDALVSDDDAAAYDEAADIIQEDYYRKVDRKQLLSSCLRSTLR